MLRRCFLFSAAFGLALVGGAQSAATGHTGAHAGSIPPPAVFIAGSPLEVVVQNVRVAKGHVHVDVCSQDTFLNEKDCLYAADAPAVAGTTTVVLPKLPPGRYAVQAYLDENDNGRVDRNRLGIPREQVGFSGNPLLITGPPRWKSVSFDHGAAGGSIRLKLRSFP